MSVWLNSLPPAPLRGEEGELLSVCVKVEAFLLEDLLEALANVSFPINPEIHHHEVMVQEGRQVPAVAVEFPVWRNRVADIEPLVERFQGEISVGPMLASASPGLQLS